MAEPSREISREPRLILLLSAGYTILIVASLFLLRNDFERLDRYRAELGRLKARATELERLAGRMGDVRDAGVRLSNLTENFGQFFASDDARSQILARFDGLARKAGVRLKSMESAEDVSAAFLSKWRVRLSLDGSYVDVIRFLEQIERAGFMVGVEGIHIRRDAESPNRLNADILATAFLRERSHSL